MPVKILSKFTPMTYNEIVTPLIQQTEAQMALENTYDEMSRQAAEYQAMANQQTDPIAYQKLKAMSDDIQTQAEALSSRGLQSSSRQALMGLRRRYNQEIVPIEQASKRRQELAEEQRKMMAQNPDLLFERNMRTVSLDDMVSNPAMDYGRTYSGAQIQADVERAIQAVSQSMGNVQVGGSLGAGVRELIKRTGMDPNQVEDYIRQGVDANTLFGEIAQNALNKSGVTSWGDQETINRAKQYAAQGFYSGYGKVDRTVIDDYEKKRQDAIIDYERKLKAQQDIVTGTETLGGITAHEAGYAVDSSGKKVKIYEDDNGNYYTKDSSANGKIKKYTPTDLKPTTTSTKETSSAASAAGYVPQSEYIQIIGGIPHSTEKEENLIEHSGDGNVVTFTEMDANHRNQVMKALGITIPDTFGEVEKNQLYKELDKYYQVFERVASDKHKESNYDWVDVKPRGNTRVVTQIGGDIQPVDYSALMQELEQQLRGQQVEVP